MSAADAGEGAKGGELLKDPLRNRGTAFSDAERDALGLRGLLPPRVETLAAQAARVVENVRGKATPLDKYRHLSGVQGENETLFFRVVVDHLEEMLPIVYTPTVGQACLEWSRIYERPRGLYLTLADRGRVIELLRRWPRREVGVIVVTDGGRILGLGDLGANGMGIPIGKLALYTACAGVHPSLCLPVTLDVGTDNEALLADPFYLGTRSHRELGPAYDELIEEFVAAAQELFPGVLIQFEDFANVNAFRLLRRYKDRACCFNDDIQGTGAMGLAGLRSARRITGLGLREQRILFAGAGEAGLGIARIVIGAMQKEGLSEAEAKARCWFMDSKGLVVKSRAGLAEHKRPYAQDREPIADLLSAVKAFRPTTLIGASGTTGLFTREVLEALARGCERPVVFALSNPTSKAECTAEQAYGWTRGRTIFASGSPFPPVTLNGRTLVPGQANNSYIFPGVGLGVIASGASRVTDEMLFAAADALAAQVTEEDLASGRIYPPQSRMREVAAGVACAVARVAFGAGLATKPEPKDIVASISNAMYEPAY
jgi:malate dehydrogenase (oxaloacetate-decarboxylating)(NADP+)